MHKLNRSGAVRRQVFSIAFYIIELSAGEERFHRKPLLAWDSPILILIDLTSTVKNWKQKMRNLLEPGQNSLWPGGRRESLR